ncbi:MAG: acyl-CoA dehydrogenase family protein [Pseudomonadota bacterium]
MNFEFNDEQHLIRDQARSFLRDNCPSSTVRGVLEGEELYSDALWKQICELGWTATVIPEEFGGLGLSYLELVVIAEEMGRACAPIPFGPSVYLATEAIMAAGTDAQKKKWLPQLAEGAAIGTLAYAEGPGETFSSALGTSAAKDTITGKKCAVANGNIASVVCVLAASDGAEGASMYLVDISETGVNAKTINTLDPSLSYADVSFNAANCELLGEQGEGWSLLNALLNRAAVLYAWEQLGGAETCLEMAKEYAMQRYAFGRPIGSFQAIKHKLAEMYVKNTLARSNAYFGAWALNSDADELALAAATARVGSCQAYYYASKENIQTHGGMGYTWEFDCQFFYRRSKALAVLIGSERQWQEKLISASDLVAV